VTDVTGDYIMHLDIQLANVSYGNHTVQAKGYQDQEG
jgi:hypothetical protein